MAQHYVDGREIVSSDHRIAFTKRAFAFGSAMMAVVLCSIGLPTSAHASNYGIELNGPYRMVSDGNWAKTNEVYMDEPTKVETWTTNTTCSSPIACTGTVASDLGWTAPIDFIGEYWLMRRDIDDWVPCPNGTTVRGRQTITFFALDPTTGERAATGSNLLVGIERTRGPSGACGVNKPVMIELPMHLVKLP